MAWTTIRRLGLICLFFIATAGAYYAYGIILSFLTVDPALQQQSQFSLAILTAMLIILLTTRLSQRVFTYLHQFIDRLSLLDFVIGIISIVIGLILGVLVSVPLSALSSPWSWIVSLFTIGLVTLGSLWVFHIKKFTLAEWFNNLPLVARLDRPADNASQSIEMTENQPVMILDTSAVIDGRIGNVVKSGFMSGTLVVPDAVLTELQHIADSSDSQKRQRGRKGLALLQSLKRSKRIHLQVSDQDYPDIPEVDQKLVKLAQQFKASIITCDYNLNRVAKVKGVEVLNVNELANLLKTEHLPGEIMKIKLIQPGKDPHQAIGYLEDGTMVVVEEASRSMGKNIEVQIHRVLQTDAGRMIFAQPKK